MGAARVIIATSAIAALCACAKEAVVAPHSRDAALVPLSFAQGGGGGAGPGSLYGPPPSPRPFGPDSYRPGLFTGQGTTTPGLTCTADACSGYLASDVDGTLLDVTVNLPQGLGAGPFPLIALLHGYAGSKSGDGNYVQSLTANGYTVLRYSARGFGHSWGQVNLADLHLEIGDLRSLIGQVVDDPRLAASPTVAVLGASYGGGQSWLSAIQPTFSTPSGQLVQIRTIVPIVPWTDILYALRPNGTADNSVDVPGFYKLSFLEGLFASGIRRDDPSRPYPNYADYLNEWNAYILALEPNNLPPVGSQIVDGLASGRSIWWQQDFWTAVRAKAGTGTQLPVFELQGFTDDLFPVPEALRMYYALRSVDPGYPIALYLGDIGHPRAPNKPDEVRYALGLIVRWLDYYLKGVGTPPSGVLAAITRPRSVPFTSADVIAVASYDALATGHAEAHFPGSSVITFNPPNPSGVFFDPFVMAGSEALDPNPPPPPPDEVPGDVAVYTVPVSQLTQSPGGLLIAGQPIVSFNIQTLAFREQLDVRLFDVTPSGESYLVTRGSYTIDTGSPATPIGSVKLSVPAYGNLWQSAAGDVLRLEITNVDSPYIEPSRIPSVTRIENVRLEVPSR